MKSHKRKKKVESSSDLESDSSSSSSSESASSNESHKKKSTTKGKKPKLSDTHKKEVSKHSESSYKDAEKKTFRKPYPEDSGAHRRIQNPKESYSGNRDAKDRDRKEKHRDHEHEKYRHEDYNHRHDFRNDRERGENNHRRNKYDESYGNYHKNQYQSETSRESYNRADESHHNQRYKDDSYHNQRYKGRHSHEQDNNRRQGRDDQRNDNKYSRNKRGRSRSKSFDHTSAKWGKNEEADDKKDKGKPVEKEKPNFGLSGKLTEERNTYKGVVIKYSEPPEARKPKRRWRLYPFKGEKALQTLYIHRESAYLIGRERKVVDLPIDHPSCSKQHAALQYRLVPFTREDGSTGKRVRPYLIDLDSANGTYINNKRTDPRKYIELLERDVIKFGFSSREYVLLHENSKDEAQDDDVKQEEEEEEVKVKKEEAND